MRKMKKWLVVGIIGLFLIGIMIPTNNVKAFGGVSARNAVLMDQKTGRILYGKAMHDSERIASITKIMTAILAVESGKMQNTITISSRAVQTEGSSIYLKPGQKIKLEDLVYGLMLRSGNDAANAIAEAVGGSIEGFVYMMNEKAKEIGMSNTYFSNPSGLDQQGKEHYSSAYDMALLTRYAMENPKYAKIAGTKVHRAPNTAESWDYVWKNKNKLLTFMYKYSTGGKTGFTKKARRTLVSTASKNGMDLIVVTLNDGQDWQDHMSLFEYGFSNYPLTKVLSKGGIKEVTNKKYKGHVYMKNDFSYPLDKKERDQVRITIEMQKPTKKKIANDAIVGKAIIELEGEQIGFRNIFYSDSKVKVFTKEIIQNGKQVLLNLMGEHSDG
ncbi:D-alanyl-D-alanine carboxypeptidase family protein [Gottfriedia acidiceleris]|uniref:serine-type D-Ala-D-Ala carboxypeptidase n=2 Tax=Bacillaceae TaxID=186817 RepID=A0ABX2ZVR7_9BACI|nr:MULTISPECIES: D-alanyl-D-alanine carboxypeptidase family protein [Bacillaceae]ODG93628.1 D-alanyl-D-alanine carboxypeptidase [Gottfriedia luciferensis]PEC48570.1 D-alanyl-D-alanine carboxypeptidase [Bacillus sp. AFS096315]PFM79916.1 D-alanyl-D-alanine carboxypeptidase [Bacillus sp. AFS077874]PGZ91063.1 D-alanyl-D-alanine carboxypeptidase [Bacillus sp. AFS029533]